MRIAPRTLRTVATDLLARYDALPAGEARTDCAFESLGILRAFVAGEQAAEEEARQCQAALLAEDDDPF